MSWVIEPLRRLFCALRGHDNILHYEQDRLSLRCLSCGYRTSGWSLRDPTFNAPSPGHGVLPQQQRNDAHDWRNQPPSSGAGFAVPSARADQAGSRSAAKEPQATGDKRRSRAIRLAS
jgi:hypothetical protein